MKIEEMTGHGRQAGPIFGILARELRSRTRSTYARSFRVRLLLLCSLIAALLSFRSSATIAHAGAHLSPTVYVGQVSDVEGPDGNPTGFTLQCRGRAIQIRIVPDTMFMARSAEAEVEGFVVGDYALVTARKARVGWIAARIAFDVRPIVRTRVSETGAIVKVGPNGKRFEMKLDSGSLRWVTIASQTQFRLNGQPVDGPLSLSRGDVVQVMMRSTPHGWLALDVNLRTGSERLS